MTVPQRPRRQVPDGRASQGDPDQVQDQRDTLRSLGLKRIGDIVVREDNKQNRGYVNTVAHLVKVEEID
jgi:large subunit ribosomal protein L30